MNFSVTEYRSISALSTCITILLSFISITLCGSWAIHTTLKSSMPYVITQGKPLLASIRRIALHVVSLKHEAPFLLERPPIDYWWYLCLCSNTTTTYYTLCTIRSWDKQIQLLPLYQEKCQKLFWMHLFRIQEHAYAYTHDYRKNLTSGLVHLDSWWCWCRYPYSEISCIVITTLLFVLVTGV